MGAPPRHVVVIGLMGSGKTTIGRRVAGRLRRTLIDGDERLEAQTGRTAAQIADAEGIDALHRREAAIFQEAMAETAPAVVAPAASIIDDDDCLAALDPHTVIWLTAPAERLAAKAMEKTHRPLLGDDDLALFRRQIAEREPRIRPRAALVIDVTEVDKDVAADRIVSLVEPAAPASS